MRPLTTALSLATFTLAAEALAVPGPDSVAVVSNANVPGSVTLANRYAEGRAVPMRQRCALDLPTGDTITLAEYRARLSAPLRRCLDEGGVDARIEAVVLTRGVPLRVSIPAVGGAQTASLAAVLMVDRARLADGTAFVDTAVPGVARTCSGSACLAARWVNPFTEGPFAPGWTAERAGVRWDMRLVTMLNGRSDDEAARLIQSALDADAAGRVPGTWMLMNGADPARGALDAEYDTVAAALRDLGQTDVARVPFNTALTGRTLAAFVTGTASLGVTIEGNRFSPGAIVDNLTSLGAVPQNFTTMGEAQVSISRWAAHGVAGAHGAVDEPLNNCFPHRRFLTEYAEGATLAEAFLRNMPFVYWRNLVLGDPMTAPWAKRPRVTARGATEGEAIEHPRAIEFHVEAPEGGAVADTIVYVDGVERARGGEAVSLCLAGDGPRELLAVSQLAADTGVGLHQPKGWTRLRVNLRGATGTCVADAGVVDASEPDASAPDASAHDVAHIGDAPRAIDAGATSDGGCGCRSSRGDAPRGGAPSWLAMLFARQLIDRRRRRCGRSA
ncbi:MAG: TIGR03790 family protein [Polyangiales bacterium]